MIKRSYLSAVPAVVLALFTIVTGTGCEQTFEPLQDNDRYAFSMYGTLDLHADTQWVRIMPVGETLLPENPELKEAEVILTRELTGESSVMEDSLFRFSNTVFVWNYGSAESLNPNEAYTITAETPDGLQSKVTVTMPSVLPVPEVEYDTEFEDATVTGSSVEPLVSFEFRYHVQVNTDFGCTPETEIILSHLGDVYVDYQDGSYLLDVENRTAIARELGVTGSNFIINRRELVIIAASGDWPDLTDLNDEETRLPDAVSNVENGTGVVAGIAARYITITPRREPC